MKLGYIDSIRGVAILLVLFVHTAKAMFVGGVSDVLTSYGQMGVQLFFVASAYTLCLSRDRNQEESNFLTKFAIRRFFRIAPMYYIGVLVYFVLSLLQALNKPLIPLIAPRYNFLNMAANLFFLHGFVPSANNSIVAGGWSIGTEVIFYVLFPLAFPIVRWIVGGDIIRAALISVGALISVWLLNFGFVYCGGEGVSNGNFWYFNIINQMPVFLIGLAYYECKGRFDGFKSRGAFLVAFVLLTSAALVIWKVTDFSGKFVFLPWLASISFVALFEVFKRFDFLNLQILRKIGECSYSIYIFNYIFACVGTGHIAPHITKRVGPEVAFVVMYALVIFMVYPISRVSFLYVERYFVKIGRRITQRI